MSWYDPGYDDYDEEPECRHEDYVIDDDMAQCSDCGERWWPGQAEIAAEHERQRRYEEYCRREERLAPWRKLISPVLAILKRLRPRKPTANYDDDLPF